MKRLAHYSQHFLRSPRLVKELIGHTSIKSGDTVYDIGAGSGVISSVLATRCQKVIAIEYEPRTAELLRKNMKDYTNVDVIEGDFLTMHFPETPYKIFANIPFHLSSAIVHKITEDKHPPTSAYMIVQKQFANKLLPDHSGFSSQLGMTIGPEFAVRIRKRLRRTDFWPHPNVDTVLLEISRRETSLLPAEKLPAYKQCLADCFSTPKKFARLPLGLLEVPPDTKPSSLTLEQWIVLFNASHYS